MTSLNWSLRTLTAITLIASATRAEAQQPQPGIGGAFQPQPKVEPKAQPRNPIVVQPQVNGIAPIPAWQVQPPAFNPFYNPALNNPWMNQTRVVPLNPFVNQPINNPLFNPNNPFVNNPFANNPFVNNPFAPNPFVNNPFAPNPFANNPFTPRPGFGPYSTYQSSPPIAFRQPGMLFWRGPDLQVNPTSGLVYQPLTGVARTGDGSMFYRVPGSGLPTVTGAYSPGTGLYFNPEAGAFLNPASGVISKPGMTNIFVPWIY